MNKSSRTGKKKKKQEKERKEMKNENVEKWNWLTTPDWQFQIDKSRQPPIGWSCPGVDTELKAQNAPNSISTKAPNQLEKGKTQDYSDIAVTH